MKCTKCTGNFEKIDYEDIILLKCNGCHSFYVKEEMFKQLTSEPEKYANVIDDPDYEKYQLDNEQTKKCPECNKKMEQHNFSWDTDILIDICTDCRSVWLDHGEISKLAEYLETHHSPLMKDVKHDAGRFLMSIKYFMHKIGHLFP